MTKFGFIRLVAILALVGFLISICVIEDKLVTDSLKRVNNFCHQIEIAIEKNGGIVNGEVASLVDNMEYCWKKDEENLCYLVNHKSIENLGVEIVRLKTYIDEEEPIEFYVSLDIIKSYVESFQHFMGAGIHNVL